MLVSFPGSPFAASIPRVAEAKHGFGSPAAKWLTGVPGANLGSQGETAVHRSRREKEMALAASLALPAGASIAIPGIVVVILIVILVLWLVF